MLPRNFVQKETMCPKCEKGTIRYQVQYGTGPNQEGKPSDKVWVEKCCHYCGHERGYYKSLGKRCVYVEES